MHTQLLKEQKLQWTEKIILHSCKTKYSKGGSIEKEKQKKKQKKKKQKKKEKKRKRKKKQVIKQKDNNKSKESGVTKVENMVQTVSWVPEGRYHYWKMFRW